MKKCDQIVHRIEDLIEQKKLKVGERVPSVRSMARQMSFSIMTVLEGYRRLENLGLIESRPQSGYFVRPKAFEVTQSTHLPEISQCNIALRTELVKIPEAVQRSIGQCQRNDVLPLGSILPSPDFFPNEELSIHLARVARTYPKVINQYHFEMGHKSLLGKISKIMFEAGCVTLEDEITVCGGETQALMMALRAVTNPGDIVAVESPGHNQFYAILDFLNLNAVEIPCDPQNGLSVEALGTVLLDGIRPACVLLSSSFSNPTGALIPEANRKKLVEICSHYNLPIIENDTYGEITFNGHRLRPLKALAPSIVIYIGDFSKILAPGYAVAWLAGGQYTNDIRRCYYMSVVTAPVVIQLAIASFLEHGSLKPHLRRLRKQYQENVRQFQSKVAQCFPPGTRISNPQGGQFLWVELPQNGDAVALSIDAIKENISIAPGIIFSSRQYYRKNFRLNCAIKWNDEVERALERLGELCTKSDDNSHTDN